MKLELIDIVDKNNKPTGKTSTIPEAHKKGLLHRSAHLWIYNSKGEILIQLRQKDKKLFPNKWDITAAGHISTNEEPIKAALRELKEELGIKLKQNEVELLEIHREQIKYKDIINNEFYYVFIAKKDINIKKLKLQIEEVKDAKFIKITTLKKELKTKKDKYVPSTWYWKFIIKEVEKRLKNN